MNTEVTQNEESNRDYSVCQVLNDKGDLTRAIYHLFQKAMGILTRKKRHGLEIVVTEKLGILNSPIEMVIGERAVFKRVTEQFINPCQDSGGHTHQQQRNGQQHRKQ